MLLIPLTISTILGFIYLPLDCDWFLTRVYEGGGGGGLNMITSDLATRKVADVTNFASTVWEKTSG